MTLPELAIKRHVTTLMILVSLVVLGGVALSRVPLAFLPEVEQPPLQGRRAKIGYEYLHATFRFTAIVRAHSVHRAVAE